MVPVKVPARDLTSSPQSSNPKIAQADYTLTDHENVGGLDVPVDCSKGVEVRETLQDLGYIVKGRKGEIHWRITPSAMRPVTGSPMRAPRSLMRLLTASKLPPAPNSIMTLTLLEEGDM